MGETLRFEAVLEKRGPAGAFLLTDEQVAAVGDGRKTFPVSVTVNGTTLALRLARMGGENMIGLNKAVRAQAGVEVDGTYTVEVAADAGERTVEVPDDLAAALAADGAAQGAFTALAYSHRKEYVRWVTEAKREQTRAERVAKTVEMVRAGQTR
ncbi:YdeI/OmpD-associated family protein [Kineosporia sp. A_224]|uniref:YdeI/OmpD-associated family protein n=1 Tax=Kineosporia sp. A_224 TaxID=1962180 RepID=UPI000B4A75E2|nr:YdeI/OmpD-associated family protein [Kineosporia sp. A_224]